MSDLQPMPPVQPTLDGATLLLQVPHPGPLRNARLVSAVIYTHDTGTVEIAPVLAFDFDPKGSP